MKKLKIYLDTSVLNFIYAEDVVKRNATINLFRLIKKGRYDAYISDVVIGEITESPKKKQKQLFPLIKKYDLTELKTDRKAEEFARKYVEAKIIPEKYYADALHISIAVVNKMDAVVSWNLRHIVKLKTQIMVNEINKRMNMPLITICSPEEVIE